MSFDDEDFKMDKTAFVVTTLDAPSDEKEFWKSKTPDEWLAALEYMRQMAYGYDPATTRLQRILETVECPWG